MSAAGIQTQSRSFKLGWWVLISISVVGVVSYLALIFVVPGLVDSFVAWATLSLYSVVILLIPYRQGEKWAWYLTWVMLIPSVVLSLNNRDAAPAYLTAVGLTAISQVLTRGAFFSRA